MAPRNELGKIRIAERIYSEPDRFGHRSLRHGAGSFVPWTTAVELGLVNPEAPPPDDAIEVILPTDLYEDAPQGGRQLVHRKGTLVSLARAKALGFGALDPFAQSGDNSDPEGDEEKTVSEREGREPRSTEKPPPDTTRPKQTVRTTKGADPKAPNPGA